MRAGCRTTSFASCNRFEQRCEKCDMRREGCRARTRIVQPRPTSNPGSHRPHHLLRHWWPPFSPLTACLRACHSPPTAAVAHPQMPLQQALSGPACSTSGRNASVKLTCSGPVGVGSRSMQQRGRSANANTVAMLPHAAPSRSSSRQLSSRTSRKHTCVVRSVLADAPSQTLEGFTRGGHWQVHKFGGTCMASPARLKDVADLVSLSPGTACLRWQHWSNPPRRCCRHGVGG